MGAVGRVVLAVEVRGLLGGGVGEAPERGRGGLGAGGVRAVELGDPLAEEGQRVGVDGEMVDPPVPEPPVVGEPDERVGEERALGEVDRSGEVGAHPGFGGGLRGVCGLGALRVGCGGGFGSQVEAVQWPWAARGQPLTGRAVGAGDHDGAQRLRLLHRLPQCPLEPVLVERTGDLDGVAGVVDRAGGVERLGVPDGGLGGEQRNVDGLGLDGLGVASLGVTRLGLGGGHGSESSSGIRNALLRLA